MATYLLDTNHASRLVHRDDPLWDRVMAASDEGHTLLLPLDVVEEMQFGVASLQDERQREQRQALLDELLTYFPPLGLTIDAALESGRIRGRLRRTGRQLGAVDAHLAGIAMLEGFILLTADRDFAPLAGEIRIENWLR